MISANKPYLSFKHWIFYYEVTNIIYCILMFHDCTSIEKRLITSTMANHSNTSTSQSSSFSLLFRFYQLKFTKTSSNGRIVEEAKGIFLHHCRCWPLPPRTFWSTHSTNSSLPFISLIIYLVFFRLSMSKVLFPILQ